MPGAGENPGPALLRVRSLGRRFGGVVAVDDLSFDVTSGERLAIIGPNGAGKSTLLRMIAGHDAPTSGSIQLEGAGAIAGRSPRRVVQAGVALARQVPRPLGSLTVRENVAVGIRSGNARRHGSATGRIDEILELTALAAKQERRARDLPLLDLKRLEMARALASEPRLLLLDEVSAGLNESELDDAIELIGSLNAQGITMLFVEHVQRVVRQLAERVLVLNWGKQIAEGTPEEVAADAQVQQVYLGGGRARPASRPAAAHVDTSGEGLAVEALTVRRGMHRAIEDVSIDVRPGEVVTVLGANGAGKTTLAAAISGILPVTSGRIAWGGTDITRVTSFRRARMGIAHCQEGRKLFPGMTVEENLNLGGLGEARAERRRRAQEVLELFPALADRRGQIATTMSGGQQQMLALARALMSRPRLLLLDEVTLGLSPKVADEIYVGIERLAQTGTAMLLVEQDAERCLDVASRAYVLAHGSVVYAGASADLTHQQLLTAYLGQTESSEAATGHEPEKKRRRTP